MTDAIAEAVAETTDDAEIRVGLERFVALLLERNAATNLTSARDPAAVMLHVRDSLGLVPFVGHTHVDIGSGGGFPGLVLAIATRKPITLVESLAKKATFLREVAALLGLPVDVVCARAEDVGRDPAFRERFATATARAVAGVTTVLELTVPLLEVGGRALLQRGRFTTLERASAHDAALVLGAEIAGEYAVDERGMVARQAVDDDGRRLLVVAKRLATGPRFPRRAGIPAKRPLCALASTMPDG